MSYPPVSSYAHSVHVWGIIYFARVIIILQLLSCVWVFMTPWTAACQAPLSFTLPELAQIHVHWVCNAIQASRSLSPPSPPALNLSQHQDIFQWVGSSHRVAKVWNFSISPSNEYSGLISYRIDRFDLLTVQGTLNSLLQHHSSKASVLQCSAFFMVQLSHLYTTTGKTIALTIQTFVGKEISLLFNMLSRFVTAFFPRSKYL